MPPSGSLQMMVRFVWLDSIFREREEQYSFSFTQVFTRDTGFGSSVLSFQ